jgi:hypothetical protein
MLTDANRTLGFFCPVCHQAVVAERSAFALAAANSQIDCPCGKAHLRVEMGERKVRTTVPCLFCGREHTFSCTPQSFLGERIMAFSCGLSGLDCCFTGEEGQVFPAMTRLQETVDALERELYVQSHPEDYGAFSSAGAPPPQSPSFLNPVVMEETLAQLRDLGAARAISCGCGCGEYSLQVYFASAELRCSRCGAVLKIPAATDTDLEELCGKIRHSIRNKS